MRDHTSEERHFCEYVMVKDPVSGSTLNEGYPIGIALDAEDYVIITVNINDQLPMGVDPLVTTTGSTLRGEDGDYLVQVPASWCKFLTSEEATDIMDLIRIDQHLLASA